MIATLPIGDHVDATAFDPTKAGFSFNGEGPSPVSPDTHKYSVAKM